MRKKICNRFDQGGFTAPICTEDSNDRFWGDEKADIFYDLFPAYPAERLVTVSRFIEVVSS